MSLKLTTIASGLIIASSITTAYAVDAAPKNWKGEAELGVVKTSGNTETQTITGRAGVTYEQDQWRHSGKLEVLNSVGNSGTTAERYLLVGKSDYKLDAKSYLFGTVGYENDRFAGFEYRTTEAIGYGRRVIDAGRVTLDLEAGPGARQTKFQSGNTQDEWMARLAGRLMWKVSDTATFTEDLGVDIGEDSTITKSVTALTARVADNLAMKATLTARNISKVPAGVEKLDTETALTLVYTY